MASEIDRVQELEMRVSALERELARERGPKGIGDLLERLLPAESRQHLRAARREQMLAVRAYVDRIISRMDEADERQQQGHRRRVKVE